MVQMGNDGGELNQSLMIKKIGVDYFKVIIFESWMQFYSNSLCSVLAAGMDNTFGCCQFCRSFVFVVIFYVNRVDIL